MRHLKVLLLIVMVLSAYLASAQAPPPGGGGGGGSTGAPIDGASGLLLLGAAAFGYSRLKNKEAAIDTEKKAK